MKTTGGFKLWQIIYPIGIYYVVSSLMYFVLGLFLGDGQQTYMLRQLICSAATIPATMSFYKQDKIAEQVVYGTEKEKLDTKWLTDAVLVVVGAAALGIAVNNIIAMTPLVQMSEGFQEANESFFAGTVVFELLGSCLVIPIAEELLFRGVVYKRLKLYFGVTPALIGSALIFGIMHVNLVQFLYAAVIGLFLAFVLEKTGDVADIPGIWQLRKPRKSAYPVYAGSARRSGKLPEGVSGETSGGTGIRGAAGSFPRGSDGSGRNRRCQPFLPEKIIRYIKTTFHYIFHKKSL